jgi:hypothetical protein
MNFIWKSDLGPEKLPEFEHIKRMITLSVITLSGFHCNMLYLVMRYIVPAASLPDQLWPCPTLTSSATACCLFWKHQVPQPKPIQEERLNFAIDNVARRTNYLLPTLDSFLKFKEN